MLHVTKVFAFLKGTCLSIRVSNIESKGSKKKRNISIFVIQTSYAKNKNYFNPGISVFYELR